MLHPKNEKDTPENNFFVLLKEKENFFLQLLQCHSWKLSFNEGKNGKMNFKKIFTETIQKSTQFYVNIVAKYGYKRKPI